MLILGFNERKRTEVYLPAGACGFADMENEK